MTFGKTTYPPIDCEKCGDPHYWCKAHNKKTGKPCRSARMKGQLVCKSHGGASPTAKAAGLRRRALDDALANHQKKIAHQEGEGITDPLSVLAKLAEEALAMKDALAARVNALTDLRYEDIKGSEQLRSEVALYERALDRSAKFVEVLAKSGFEEARVRLETHKGLLVAAVLERVLDQLELNERQRTLVGHVVPHELRRLGTGENR